MSRNNIFTALVIGLICLFSCSTLWSADMLTVAGKRVDQSESTASIDGRSQFRSGVSTRNLLGLSREAPHALPDLSLGSLGEVTLRICAIRVQFEYEEVDDVNTTGRGHYDFRTTEQFIAEERHEIDMAPHDRNYFERHLEALNNYYGVVSQGRVRLTGYLDPEKAGDVFPVQPDSVYNLDKTMGHYGSQPPLPGLGEFFISSFRLADLDDDIDFSQYDVFIVFHPGADQQTDLGFPPTPYDLYTGFIRLGSDLPELWVDDSTYRIMDGIMMPETAYQDNRVVALNGVFAHEFAHQLGAIDLYDTRTWMSQIGDFALQDNQGRGTAAEVYFEEAQSFRFVLDVLPVFPDAWSRAYMGFVDVVEVGNVSNQQIWAAELETDMPQVIKVPISDHEYFLIENRQVDSDADDSTNLRIDPETGVILGPAPASAEDPRRLTRDYDYFIPGSGMLIWHVDETRAYLDYNQNGFNNFQENMVQWYNFYPCLIPNDLGLCIDSIEWENRRFLSIVEADGVVDFGGNYRTRFGSPYDLFYEGNNSTFTPTTNPPTTSASGGYTGISIFRISEIDTIMTFDVRLESRVEGFPKFVNGSSFAPILAHLDRDGVEEIFVSGLHNVVAMRADGSPIIQPLTGEEVFDSSMVTYGDELQTVGFKVDTLRSIASVPTDEYIVTPPLVFDFDADGVVEVALATDANKLYMWEISDGDNDGRADEQAIFNLTAGEICAGPVAVPSGSGGASMLLGTENGFYRYDYAGNLVDEQDIGPVCEFSVGVSDFFAVAGPSGQRQSTVLVNSLGEILHDFGDEDVVDFTVADLDSSQGVDFAAITSDGKLIILLSNTTDAYVFNENTTKVADSLSGQIVTAALDPTVPYYQVIFAGDNTVYAYNYNGSPFENFPQVVDAHNPAGMILTQPIVADVDGDLLPEVIVGTQYGEAHAFRTDGQRPSGFPRFAGSWQCFGNAVISGSAANNYAGYLFSISADNRLYGQNIKSRTLSSDQVWRSSGNSVSQYNYRGPASFSPTQTQGSELITSFYNYPNPANDFTNIRYRLSDEGTVNISIYDVSGRLVYEDVVPGENVGKDYRWNLDGYPSGVYICRLEAEVNGSSEVKTKKIAVVK